MGREEAEAARTRRIRDTGYRIQDAGWEAARTRPIRDGRQMRDTGYGMSFAPHFVASIVANFVDS